MYMADDYEITPYDMDYLLKFRLTGDARQY